MAVEDAQDRAVFFDTGDFAVAGTYTPAAGAPAAVDVVLDRPTARTGAGLTGAASTAWRAVLGADQIAACAKGDTLVADGGTFKVRRADRDETGKLWTLELEKQ